MRALSGLLLVFASACSELSPPGPAALANDLTHGAPVVLTPDATLRPAVERWAARWSVASGVPVVLGDGGVPVELVAELTDADGEERAGWTSPARDRVLIHYRARDIEQAVGHELGHVLGGDHTDTDGVLSGRKGARPVIDGAALESVCRRGCSAFSPEE